MKRLHRQLLLALCVFGSGAGSAIYVYAAKLRTQKDRTLAEHESLRLFRFGRDDVRRGALLARGTTIAFARDGARGWRLTAPIDAPADATAIDGALDRMAGVRLEPDDPTSNASGNANGNANGNASGGGEVDAEALRRYELDHPHAWMKVETRKGDFELLVGAKNPLDDHYFVTDAGRRRIGRAEGNFFWALDRPPEAFRERRIFPFPRDHVRRLAVRGPGVEYVLERTRDTLSVGDGRRPPQPADAAETNLLLVAVVDHLRAERWISDDLPPDNPRALAALGVGPLEWTIEVATATTTLRVRLGRLAEMGADQGVLALIADGTRTVAAVPDWIEKDLRRTVDQLADRSVAYFERDAVQRIELSLPGGERAVLDRVPGTVEEQWTVGATHRPALGWKVAPILFSGSRLRVDRWLDEKSAGAPASLGLAPPRARLRFLDHAGQVLGDVLIGRELGDGMVAVMAAGSTRAGAYPRRLAAILPAHEHELEDTAAADGGIPVAP